jgi:hypothetical protein
VELVGLLKERDFCCCTTGLVLCAELSNRARGFVVDDLGNCVPAVLPNNRWPGRKCDAVLEEVAALQSGNHW